MIGYRLVLRSDGSGPERTGYVFCRDDVHAREAVKAVLQQNPNCHTAAAYDGDRLAFVLDQKAPPGS